ncbi:MAG: tetratricopeptide repeat protein [Bacteroidetes bacterium]|nr:tetratricopeptide repeat protein [Bacteroidota bacterium]
MSGESAFEKLHVDEKRKADLGSLLEELNLPPKAVEYVRRNQTVIYVTIIIVILAIISWSMYGTYKDKKINQSSSALATAKKEPVSVRIEALQKVVTDYGDTKASLWATIELAHEDVKNKKYEAAVEKYASARNEIKENNLLFPLLTYGIAQAFEAEGKYSQAMGEYITMKTMEGYKGIGFMGTARILEIQGKMGQALASYEEYLSTFTGEDLNNPDKILVQEKISFLKAHN